MNLRRPGLVAAVVVTAACGRVRFDPIGGEDSRADAVPTISGRHWIDRMDGTPGALLGPRMAYVPGRGIVMYGGTLDAPTPTMPPTMPVAAMWQLGAGGWTLLCDPCAPGKRVGHALAYDALRARLVLFGGLDELGVLHADVWEWDGSTWTQASPTGPAPSPRGLSSMVYDESRAKLVVLGGEVGGASTADVYEYDGTAWTHPQPAPGPSSVACGGQCATYDSGTHRVVALADDGALTTELDEAWAWDGTAWSRVCASCTGRKRVSASLVYDPATRSHFEIGGYDIVNLTSIAGTWQSTTPTWTEISTLPDRRDSSAVAWDGSRNVIVLYGGNGEACNGPANHNCAETWELVPDGA